MLFDKWDGKIDVGGDLKMTDKIDPELVQDENDEPKTDDVAAFPLPDYDPEDFELPDDYEYVEEEGEENGSEE